MTHCTILERPGPGPAALAALAAGALLAAALAPATASAAVVSKTGSVVTFQASPGEIDQVRPFVENGRVRVHEASPPTPLFAGLGCQIVSERLADCGGPARRIVINLGDLNDTYLGQGAGSVPATVNGDAGNDEMVDGAGSARKESYNGGGGIDKASYVGAGGAVSLSLDGLSNDGEGGEGDLIGSGMEALEGGAHADSLTGNAGLNLFTGNNGADTVTGLGGRDFFSEGSSTSGADLIIGGAAAT